MALRLRLFGARGYLRDGFTAGSEGRVEDALFAMRAYFGSRDNTRESLNAADADAAILLATCAALRGDERELAAVKAMVGDDSDAPLYVIRAREWIATLSLALAGNVVQVAADLETGRVAVPRGLADGLVLLAAERSERSPDGAALHAVRRVAGHGAAHVRARAIAILAREALARGDRLAALAELEAMPPNAPPIYRFLAALTTGRAALERCWRDIPAADRMVAGALVAAFAVGASPTVIETILSVLGADIDGAIRSTLEATLVVSCTRTGEATRALDRGNGGSSVVAAARAQAMLVAGRFEEAATELATFAPQVSRDLSMLAAAAVADDTRVLELIRTEDVPASETRAAISAHLAVRNELPASLPAWLDRAPNDPLGLYAWALLETRRGRGSNATSAFERAIEVRPALAGLGDAPDIARLLAAREAFQANDLDAAASALVPITSRRLERTKMTLHALVLVRRAANAKALTLDQNTLSTLVRELDGRLPPGSVDHAALALLERQADALRASWLLRQGRAVEAAPVIARLPKHDANGALMHATLGIVEGRPLPEIEHDLATALQLHPDERPLALLLAEVRGARGGAEARVSALEQLHTASAADALVEEALVSAYGGAQRGLDAKRVALEELRRRGALGTLMSAQLAEALSFEAQPRSRRHATGAVDAGGGSALPEATLSARAHLLVAHAEDTARATPARRKVIEAAVARFKHALLSDQLSSAAAAEAEVLAACSGVSI